MQYSFNSKIAELYSVEGAVVIENLYFWISKNEANEKHFYDGEYWTYNSIKAFSKLFPFWTQRQLERILNNLEKNGAIKTGNYNKVGYDRTKWYSLTETVKSIYANGEMDLRKPLNRNTKSVEPIPDNNTDIKTTDSKPDISVEEVWKLYPLKAGKDKAMKKIPNLIKKHGLEQIKNTVIRYIAYVDHRRKTDFKDLKYQNGSTFFNSTYVDYLDENYIPIEETRNQTTATKERVGRILEG
jgi:hypothetical protein